MYQGFLSSVSTAQVAGMLTSLQEVKSIICSYIHQAFISDPNLAKLVHFQVYIMYYVGWLCTSRYIPCMM
ncbi:hypothetical protein DPMN_015658 [Dreissena polymorpha]|uniref:Uncharacterized protein n=1 Tax=Dreissena polymorpha TaxID=45954 RepID=A0A9D4S3U2_DREPO|nr:hypothetical protein DPMN_015658 [Dreissena polymorpha]